MSRRANGPARPGTAAAVWLAPAIIAVITVIAFIPALSAGFVTWDDDRNFLNNLHWRGLGGTQLAWMWTTFHMGHYVPLSWMTLGLDYAVWGMNPVGYHATNVTLHAVNAVLVYFVARRLIALAAPALARDLTGLSASSALAALLFAIHPLRVESVAWITERRDVLSGVLFTLTIACYLRSADPGRDRRWYWAAVVVFACGMLAKASVMTVPAVLIVLNCYPLRRLPGSGGLTGSGARGVYAEIVPFALISVITAGLSIVALKPPDQLAPAGKVAVSAYSFAFYVAKTLWPAGLAPLYEMPKAIDPMAWRYVLAYAVTIAAAAAAWATRKRWPSVPAAVAAFTIVLLPTIGFVQNGPQIAADRYTYHAAPALAILAGGGFLALSVRWRTGARIGARIAAVAMVVALGVTTWKQSKIWHDSETLWSRVLAVDPASSIAHVGLASEYARAGRLGEAVTHYERGLAIDSAYAEGHNNIGVALVKLGRLDDAVAHYRRAIALRPAYDEAYSNWGIAAARQGDFAQAMQHYEKAVALNPENADARVNWGNALVRLDRPDEAIAHYQAALSLRPDDADAYLNWGVALARRQRFDEAIEKFQRALDIQPDLAEARTFLDRAQQLRQSPPRRP